MKIEHVAIWVKDLEAMKTFYERYFNGKSNSKYHNTDKEFESYFLRFDGEVRLEIMRKSGIDKQDQDHRIGWAHIAFSLGSRESVNQLTVRLQTDGYRLVKGRLL